jgi:hypothetical protein
MIHLRQFMDTHRTNAKIQLTIEKAQGHAGKPTSGWSDPKVASLLSKKSRKRAFQYLTTLIHQEGLEGLGGLSLLKG